MLITLVQLQDLVLHWLVQRLLRDHFRAQNHFDGWDPWLSNLCGITMVLSVVS